MKALLMGSLVDEQTAVYILNSFRDFTEDAAAIDIRRIISDFGFEKGQDRIIQEVKEIDIKPDLIVVLKGMEMTLNTLKEIKKFHPESKIVNWFFDVNLKDKEIWKQEEYFDFIRFFDKFFCSLKGVADKLKESGFENTEHLPEGCYPEKNGEKHLNNFQKKKYEADISFCGTLGLDLHRDRTRFLERISKEGFHMKIYGNIARGWKYISPLLRPMHQRIQAINETHSMVSQCSAINLGIDQRPDLEQSQSARLYRVLCAGGCYLNTYTKGIEKVFKVNTDITMPTGEEELVVFSDENSLVKIIDYLLEHPEITSKIGKNGQKKVLGEHKFTDRIKDMLKILNFEVN